jgi:hypothetical protein
MRKIGWNSLRLLKALKQKKRQRTLSLLRVQLGQRQSESHQGR